MITKTDHNLPHSQLSTNFVLVLLDYLRTVESVNTDKFLKKVNLTEASLLKQNSMSPMSTFLRLIEAASIYINDPNLGLHYYANFDFKKMGVLGYALLNSESLGRAFSIRSRYHSLLQSNAKIKISSDNETTQISYQVTTKTQPYNRQDTEMVLMSFVSLARQLVDDDWRPSEAHSQHSKPQDINEHKRLICSDLHFDQTTSKIVFDKSIHSAPLSNIDKELGQSLTVTMDQLLTLSEPPPEKNWQNSLQDLIVDSLVDNELNVETIAKRLGFSARTLQRRLSEEGTNFKDLVENIRCQLAINYLSGSDFSLQDVAFLLGYSDVSSLDRAFKRWTRCSPLEYRKPYQSSQLS